MMPKQPNLLLSVGAPWFLPVVCVGVFLHKYFICQDDSNPTDARKKAAARLGARPPSRVRGRRARSSKPPPSSQHASMEACEQAGSEQQQLADAALGAGDAVYEVYAEDEVEALHQAQANQQALLNLLQQYGSRMVAEGIFDDDYDDDGRSSQLSEGSMWYTDDPDHSWQHDDASSGGQHYGELEPQYHHQQQQQQQQQQGTQLLTSAAAADGSQAPSLQQQQQQAGEFLHRLAAAMQQQQQQREGAAAAERASDAADAASEGAYFDDSHWGLPSDPSRSPQDLQELQAAVTRNLEALLPKDSTWTGSSYPPHFDELLSPSGPAAAAAAAAGPQRGYELEEPEFDFDDGDFELDDPGFDYVPDFDFDFDPGYDPEFEADLLDDMLDLNLEGFVA